MIERLTISEKDRTTLAQLAIAPEDIADDFCDYSKVIVRKPWGYEYLIYSNESVAVWILYLKKDAQTSMHCHPNKKTSLVVLEGEVECANLDARWQRSTGQGLLIEKAVFHQTRALSDGGAFIMEIETPVNKRDLVRIKDLYGRAGKGYESAEEHSTNLQNYNYITLTGPAIAYNQKKRFAKCSLTFKHGSTTRELQELLQHNEGDDVICVLKGELRASAGAVAFQAGDTKSIDTLRTLGDLIAESDTELLLIKKVDSDIKVSDYIAHFLKTKGIREVFAVPGDANVHLLDSLGREDGINLRAFQSEAGASLSTEGYSKVAGAIGTLVISSGGSGPRALPGVANSWIDSAPMLVISGQARTDQESDGRVRQLGNKALNIVDVVAPITKYHYKITDPLSVRYHLERAVHEASTGRPGPVWLDIPIDILGMTVDQKDLTPFVADELPEKNTQLAEKVGEVYRLLHSAKRPVLLCGSGIRCAHAQGEFIQLAEKLGLPVLSSRRGADLIAESHPLFVGRPGSFGQRCANFIIQNADLILIIGSRLSIPFIGRNCAAFGRGAKKIIVDIDPAELTKETVHADVAICSSAKEFIEAMLQSAPSTVPDYPEWWSRCRKWRTDFPPLKEGYAHHTAINPYLFVHQLSQQLAPSDTIVVDGGAVLHMTMQVFAFKAQQRLITSTGLELPGFALSGAIGAAIASRSSRVVCLCEDRGFQLSISELQTIIDNKLSLVIFVLKSRGNATVRKIQKDFFGGRYVGTDSEILFGSPQLLDIGRAYGFEVMTIGSPEQLSADITKALAAKKPTIAEIVVDSEQELSPRLGFTVKEDGKWVARPLEDMYPFLPRETLQENMLIDVLEEK